MLRIISGSHKGRILKTVEGSSTRPTSDRVKESLFNILQSRLPGSVVLDVFSGTGNLGLEALSRGSLRAVFIEKDPKAVAVLRSNCEALGYLENTQILQKDVQVGLKALIERKDIFDVIFLDPPYNKDLEVPVLRTIFEGDLLCAEGIIAVEHLTKDPQPERIEGLMRSDCRRYGNTSISFYRKAVPGQQTPT